MEQDEDFNFDRELLDEDQDNELFYNFGDFEESQDLEFVQKLPLYTLFRLYFQNQKIFKYKTLRISYSTHYYSYKK